MEDLLHYKRCLNISIIGSAIALISTGDEAIYSICYALVFVFMVLRAFMIKTKTLVKFYLIISYTLITVAQLSYCNQGVFSNISLFAVYFNKLLCTTFLSVPFLIEKIFTVKKYVDFRLPSLEELYVLPFAQLRQMESSVGTKIDGIKKAKQSFSKRNIEEIITDLPRHSSFKYVNNGNLTDEYFQKAYSSLDDENIYLIISSTGSAASEVISVFTQKTFNHSSIAFDYNLETIISYNGGERVYPPGLNLEMVELFRKKEDSSILVYSLKTTREQKKAIIDKVKEINEEGSAYNLLGLLLGKSYKPNIMFCSQFVYKMLEIGGVTYFKKDGTKVKPTDFVEMDYYRKLKYEYEIIGKSQLSEQQAKELIHA